MDNTENPGIIADVHNKLFIKIYQHFYIMSSEILSIFTSADPYEKKEKLEIDFPSREKK